MIHKCGGNVEIQEKDNDACVNMCCNKKCYMIEQCSMNIVLCITAIVVRENSKRMIWQLEVNHVVKM